MRQHRSPRLLTLIHNPSAGDRRWSAKALRRLLERAGYKVRYQSSKGERFEAALEDPGELVVVAGGDGTVAKVATRLAGRGAPIAILPLGTANNIATSLGVEGLPEDLIATLASARRVRFDLGAAKGPWGESLFLEAVGFGLIPRMIASARSKKKSLRGGARAFPPFAWELRLLNRMLRRAPVREATILLDGKQFSRKCLLLEAMNIGSIGPRLLLAPEANPGDGHLDLVCVGPDQRRELARYLEGRLAGRERPADFRLARAKRIEIRWPGTDVHVDDEVPAKQKSRVSLSIGEKRVEFLVPRQTAPATVRAPHPGGPSALRRSERARRQGNRHAPIPPRAPRSVAPDSR
ncbi:MAG TPA: diacylglycerol kinase family protein [Thermoanaerobaculia bacterium]